MTELSESQEKILLNLKQRGPQTAKTLADKLGMTTMGARQHLAALRDKRLVEEAEESKQGRGRPVKPWRLTDKAHSRFPDAHSQITADLIASVRDVFGEQAMDQLIDRRTKVTTAQYRQAVNKHVSLAKKCKPWPACAATRVTWPKRSRKIVIAGCWWKTTAPFAPPRAPAKAFAARNWKPFKPCLKGSRRWNAPSIYRKAPGDALM